jgi:outer membrane protein assembly factor BamB
MMDIDGFTLWETTNVYSSFIRPSPNGKYAVGFVRESDRVETGLYVYEEQKNNPLKIDIFSLKRIKDAQFDFSNDGKVWAALVDVIFQLAEKRYYAVSLLYFLDVNKLLWKISPESYIRDMGEDNIELYGWEIAVSKTGKFVSILIMRKIENTEKRDVTIYTYDNKGKLLWKHLLRESDYKFAFSDSERHIYAAGVQSKQIYCFDSLSGKLEWEVDGTEIDGYEISALLVSKNNATIAVVLSSHPNLTLSDERRKLYDEFIHVFDNYGKKIKTWKFSRGTILHRDEDYTPCVEISDNGKKVFVATKEGIISCNIHRAEIKE